MNPKRKDCSLDLERWAWRKGYRTVAGVDEVGRGALAGPVVAAAVILHPDRIPEGIDDSKRVPAARRVRLSAAIQESALAFAIATVDAAEIDRINILQATRSAMAQAVGQLRPPPDYLLIDALTLHGILIEQKGIIRGDQISQSIAAASILAKVMRDKFMQAMHHEFPHYGWDHNVGYATRLHREAIARLGPTPLHRRSFAGVCSEQERLWVEEN